ncbi:plasminogen-binding N-terminal domain-containing protein [Campylobacter geochelonis]|uniref:Plasminogen-binding protein pgbA n=1 Tax=Campylobacter geochelonis TaxID=1780362 RepID=A0A128EJJ1_9BACT|nr:plasminogen-binding N-terminal domain-containing protein [Campylobacter geochelonis]QKF71612.1 putative plasminogen-binding protein [Campylobacter geochelonis]CZE48685.1 Plasminogen-binding protein pgbA [Campylobacter geochelonis]CZE48721.1 Plasminogen-binding protein pgbA [Campylobacter geochelonis]
MRYFLAILALFTSILSASSFNLPTYETPILKVENGFAQILDNKDIIVGSSGVVTHTFSNGESSIIARAVVVEKELGLAKIRFEVYSALEQPALPLPGILPKSGDKVTLNFLYSRAVIVAPNQEVYEQIVKFFPNITFVNPDLAGAYLAFNHKPNPSRDDFRNICAQNGAGLIFIAMDGQGVFADCGSFEILKSFKSGSVSHYQVPFYSQIRGIEPAFWKLDSSYISNYNKHYKFLLDIKDEK